MLIIISTKILGAYEIVKVFLLHNVHHLNNYVDNYNKSCSTIHTNLPLKISSHISHTAQETDIQEGYWWWCSYQRKIVTVDLYLKTYIHTYIHTYIMDCLVNSIMPILQICTYGLTLVSVQICTLFNILLQHTYARYNTHANFAGLTLLVRYVCALRITRVYDVIKLGVTTLWIENNNY